MEPAEPNPFNQFLLEVRRGSLHAELSERMQDLVNAVAEHEKAGSLTLTIRIAPAGKRTGQYEISDKLDLKIPEADRGSSLFFGLNGNLSRSDPRQPELPIREVPAPPSNVREVEL
jgi:hypothetical protein